MREFNCASIGRRIQNANPLHRRRAVEPPTVECFMSRPYTLEASGEQTAPAPQKHREELRGEAELLGCRINAPSTTDGECISAIAAFRDRNAGGMQCIG